mgnify:CR=1 FL=1
MTMEGHCWHRQQEKINGPLVHLESVRGGVGCGRWGGVVVGGARVWEARLGCGRWDRVVGGGARV